MMQNGLADSAIAVALFTWTRTLNPHAVAAVPFVRAPVFHMFGKAPFPLGEPEYLMGMLSAISPTSLPSFSKDILTVDVSG
jgi:hypothetical protein